MSVTGFKLYKPQQKNIMDLRGIHFIVWNNNCKFVTTIIIR
ncbi:hypothetical protein FORMB_15370 [Formosa sp. Hel1_33_131]|nr:hypothetical protein FORMB_15370 [Formosa sp. Hel1_33_131]